MFDANAFERGKHQRRIRIALALEVAHVRPHFIESQAADSSERAWPAIHSPQISGAIGIGLDMLFARLPRIPSLRWGFER